MNSARRSHTRRDWPRGLYEPRPGYYAWRHPDGRNFTLGAIPLVSARHQALQANAHLMANQPSLLDRLTGGGNTVAELTARMPVSENANTAKTHRTIDKRILASLGQRACLEVTVADCAELVEGVRDAGLERTSQSMRSRLVAICRRGMQLGWMDSNPAEITNNPAVVVKRGRLTLEAFQAVYLAAAAEAEWLPLAMMLALVTGQDRSTVVSMTHKDIDTLDGERMLLVQRSKTAKTNNAVAIPLRLRLDAVGVSVESLVATRTGVSSNFLVHHQRSYNNAAAGTAVFVDNVSKAFTRARVAAGIPDIGPDGKGAPTFHEIRSLSKRLYDLQGDVDTKALLGHATTRASELYADPRGVSAIRVRVG